MRSSFKVGPQPRGQLGQASWQSPLRCQFSPGARAQAASSMEQALVDNHVPSSTEQGDTMCPSNMEASLGNLGKG